MSEDEAKATGRCCGPEGCGSAGDPEYDGGPVTRWCIGSACMGWRWDRDFPSMRVKNMAGEEFLVTPEVYAKDWRGVDFETVPPQGFCGLAGKP